MNHKDCDKTHEAAKIASRFIEGTAVDVIEPLGEGLINHTFLVIAGTDHWVLQRINDHVFAHPRRIMENLTLLSTHLADKPCGDLQVPVPVKAADGAPWICGEDGGLWRLVRFVEGGRALDRIEDGDQAAEVGRALAIFHLAVADLSPGALAVTLPGFHVTPDYVARFADVVEGSSGACRTTELREAIAFVAGKRKTAGVLEQARTAGLIPEHVIHGDPKLDNILFDRSRRRALAIIDLDTVQPGVVHYDIGDCLRSCCNRGGESSADCPRASFDLAVCRDLLGAYAEETKDLLVAPEVELLYDTIRIIPFELGVRFLTDYLEGDRWFRVTRPGENLTRARIQFALADDIERKEVAIRAIIGACFGRRCS